MAIPKVMNESDVQKVFGVGRDAISRLVKAGKLQRFKMGQRKNGYFEKDVERAFRELRREAQQ